jgi:hypothetical protein
MMKWNHLPITGGIYAQHPKMLDDFLIIHGINVAAKNRQQALEARKARRK